MSYHLTWKKWFSRGDIQWKLRKLIEALEPDCEFIDLTLFATGKHDDP